MQFENLLNFTCILIGLFYTSIGLYYGVSGLYYSIVTDEPLKTYIDDLIYYFIPNIGFGLFFLL